MIEIYQLRQLVAFDKFGTLSKAADEIHISQPALTRSMQKLETDLQVHIFDRQKNKLTLNENGKLTVSHAKKVLEQMDSMVTQVRQFDRAAHTISIGSCAPAPLWSLIPELSRNYSNMTISSEIKNNSEYLINNLISGYYQMIVLPFQPDGADLCSKKYMEEQLNFCVPPTHPLAQRPSICFADIDGENMILFSEIGFWHDIHVKRMPHSHFIIQSERLDFDQLVNASVLPCFSTDASIKYFGTHGNRVNILLTDKDAKATFYLVWCKNSSLLNKII